MELPMYRSFRVQRMNVIVHELVAERPVSRVSVLTDPASRRCCCMRRGKSEELGEGYPLEHL